MISDNQLAHGINSLVYGLWVDVEIRLKTHHNVLLYLCQGDVGQLTFTNNDNGSTVYLKLIEIDQINDVMYSNNKLLIMTKWTQFKLIFKNQEQKTNIQDGLRYLIEEAQNIQTIDFKYSIQQADSNHDDKIDKTEFISLMKSLQISLDDKKIHAVYKKFKTLQQINPEELILFLEDISQNPEIIRIFSQYIKHSKPLFQKNISMNREELKMFIKNEQRESMQEEWIDQLFIGQDGIYQEGIEIKSFYDILLNINNSIFQPDKLNQYQVLFIEVLYPQQDENYSLTSYQISSSHNTYLKSNQLTGISSLQAYIDAFKMGFKCVEVDCWDGKNGEPIVTHGHTLTSSLLFEDVIKIIDKYAFCMSNYPVIISLEVHCGFSQQGRMADIIKKVLSNKIFTISPDYQIDCNSYPTLAELKNKIILKNKQDGEQLKNETQELNQSDVRKKLIKLKTYDVQSSHEKSINQQEDFGHDNASLQRIVALFGTKLDLKKEFPLIWCITSIEEAHLDKIIQEKQQAPILQGLLKSYFARVFPKGTRIDSSNYNPMPAWNSGAQLVALNVQTKDLPMLLNQGKFQENGFSKSYWLCPQTTHVQFEYEDTNENNIWVPLGFEWANQSLRYMCEVNLVGKNQESSNFRTITVYKNSYNPSFQNYLVDVEFKNPEQVMIYFQVFSENAWSSELVSQYAISVLCIREGYRVVPLWDHNLVPQHQSFLFVQTKIDMHQ